MSEFSQQQFIEIGQTIYQDLVKSYHDVLHNPNTNDGYGELEDHTLPYQWFAEMSFAAAEEFAKVFRHQEELK